MSVHFEKAVIIGVGLIGASLGLAARRKGLFGRTVGVGRSRANLERARDMGAVDRYLHDPREACRDADLVILAAPVERILATGREVAPLLRRGACLTDVGSVKLALVRGLEGVVAPGAAFVGGHPLAGGEESGAAAGRADLFQGARTVLTPTPSTDPGARARIRALWEAVGAEVVEMDAAEHDAVLAAVSHLPHVAAYALADLLAGLEETNPGVAGFAAGGFRDITRIASSPPELWTEICKLNKEKVLEMIRGYETILERIRREIAEDRFDALRRTFERGRDFRQGL